MTGVFTIGRGRAACMCWLIQTGTHTVIFTNYRRESCEEMSTSPSLSRIELDGKMFQYDVAIVYSHTGKVRIADTDTRLSNQP